MKSLIFSCVESRVEDGQVIYGCFKLGPFHSNQGMTVGNALRRTLLSTLDGLAIAFVKIEGVKHEYSIINGVQESVLEILVNLKQIQFKTNSFLYKPEIAYLNIKGPNIIYSKDIDLPNQIECVNPWQYIATLSCDGELKIKFFICQGTRYYLQSSIKNIVQDHFSEILNIKNTNFLFLDALFVPVNKVNFIIEENQVLNKEFIILEIWTKGGIHPKQCLYKAINELIKIFLPFRRFQKIDILENLTNYPMITFFQDKELKNIFEQTKFRPAKLYKKLLTLEISNLNLSLKTYLVLKKNNIHTILDLVNQLQTYSILFNKKELNTLMELKNIVLHN